MTLRVDWERREIGRLRCSYGATKREHASFVALLDELYERNCFDVLRALKAGKLTPRELMAEKRAGRHLELNVLLNVALNKPLWETLDAMIALRPGGEKHKRRMRDSLKKLRASGLLSERATIADLRDLKKAQLRPLYASAADFNHARKAILTPLSQLFGDPFHPFRREVLKALGKREKEVHRSLAVTPELFWSLVEAMPEHLRPAIVTLAVTGLRLNTEYLRCNEASLRPEALGVYCKGSKNADATGLVRVAEQLWPWVSRGIPCRFQGNYIRRAFHKACIEVGLGRYVRTGRNKSRKVWRRDHEAAALITSNGLVATRRFLAGTKVTPEVRYEGLSLHDLRHLTAIFAFAGGASMNEVQAHMRHADANMTLRYSKLSDGRAGAEAIGRALERPTERAD